MIWKSQGEMIVCDCRDNVVVCIMLGGLKWYVYPYTQSIVHTQIEKNSVSGESRGRSSSMVLEFRHRQIGGFTLHSVGMGQLNYVSAKTTNSSTFIPIRMSRVKWLSYGLKGML